MNKYYKISHIPTGYSFGHWVDREAAENYRNQLDDWMDWTIELVEE